MGVDEVLGFLVLYRGDACRYLVHGIAHALHIRIAARIGDLHEALVSRFENFRIGSLQVFGDYFLGLFFVGKRIADTLDETLEEALGRVRTFPGKAVGCFDHLLRIGNSEVRDVHDNRIALFFRGDVQGRRDDRSIDGPGRQGLETVRLRTELNNNDILGRVEAVFL